MDQPEEAPHATTQNQIFVRAVLLLLVFCGLVALALAWSFSPLEDWLDLNRVVAGLRQFAENFGLVTAIFAFAAALVFVVPLTFLTIVVVIAFGPLYGFICAMSGAQLSALCSYAIGAVLGRDVVRSIGGPRVNRVSRKLAKRGLVAVIAVRMVPVAPFGVVNMIAGASHIQLHTLLLGTLIGMAPGTLVIALFVETIIGWQR